MNLKRWLPLLQPRSFVTAWSAVVLISLALLLGDLLLAVGLLAAKAKYSEEVEALLGGPLVLAEPLVALAFVLAIGITVVTRRRRRQIPPLIKASNVQISVLWLFTFIQVVLWIVVWIFFVILAWPEC
jgi:hypothetical protein